MDKCMIKLEIFKYKRIVFQQVLIPHIFFGKSCLVYVVYIQQENGGGCFDFVYLFWDDETN